MKTFPCRVRGRALAALALAVLAVLAACDRGAAPVGVSSASLAAPLAAADGPDAAPPCTPDSCALAHAHAVCAAGACRVAGCEAGFEDCDGDAANGCEADLGSPDACGACGAICTGAHATMRCEGGACVVAACAPGFADCDGDARTGCEADLASPRDCGACGHTCELANAVERCEAGSCGLAACASRFADCDDDPASGCETRLDRLSDCGGCGVRCEPAHAVGSCATGSCAIARCAAGFASCDGQTPNGCETDVYADEQHCGSCSRSCAAGEECLDGRCVAGFVDLCAGDYHTCALRASGEVLCWGGNSNGQLGHGTVNDFRLPLPVTGLGDAVQLACGGYHTCARRAGGTVVCWGRDAEGQAGTGGSGDGRQWLEPVSVVGLDDVVDVSAGYMQTCAVRSTGDLLCWGSASGGGEWMPDRGVLDAVPLPTPRPGFPLAQRVGAGLHHICVLGRDGSVTCEDDISHFHGNPTPPTRVDGITDAVALRVAAGFRCALDQQGGVSCWGDNFWGQLGDGTLTSRQNTAAPVLLPGPASAFAIGGSLLGCATLTTGGVSCWGKVENGGLGDGSDGPHETPVPVLGLVDAGLVAAGNGHVCTLRSTGGIDCWGQNGGGQCGTIFLGTFLTPTHVSTLP
jgi:alpha-tubulin suppressor-like RCC1 family protein